jgi:hypothetical protein
MSERPVSISHKHSMTLNPPDVTLKLLGAHCIFHKRSNDRVSAAAAHCLSGRRRLQTGLDRRRTLFGIVARIESGTLRLAVTTA